MILKNTPKIDKKMMLNRKLREKIRILLKNVGKIEISLFLNRKLLGKCSKSVSLSRELPEFGIALDARFCKLGPTAARLRPLNKAEAP